MKLRYSFPLVLGVWAILTLSPRPPLADAPTFYRGVDLSYVNEMDDCGAVYRVNGEARDPYQIFADYGANLVRIRL